MSETTFLKVYTDGGSRGNPGPAACAFIVKDKTGKILAKRGKFLGIKTNNVAEYQAVVEALKWLLENISSSQQTVNFFLDSRLIVNQLNGYFKIKNSRLRELIVKIKTKEAETGLKIFYLLIPREKNKEADSLVNKILESSDMKSK